MMAHMAPSPRRRAALAALAALGSLPALLACGGGGEGRRSPSDDPDSYAVDSSVSYDPQVSAPRWVIPADNLPAEASPMTSNNNVDIFLHGGRLLLAWRTAETHMASANARMLLISSPDRGGRWDFEARFALGRDVREPRFLLAQGRLQFYFFEAGVNPLAFEPRQMWRTERRGLGSWTSPATFGGAAEVPWTVRWRGDRAYMSLYTGEHYNLDKKGGLSVLLRVSTDGVRWQDVDPGRPAVYRGGVSEAGFELDEAGGLWAVLRNEDGDRTGFGSLVCTAPPGALGVWDCPQQSDPHKYDSPWLFRHGVDLYLVARRNVDGRFDKGTAGLSFSEQKKQYLSRYSTTPKRTALYRIDRQTRAVVHLQDLPSAGDTAFPSVRQTGPHTFLLANYSSPLDQPDISWLAAQVSPRGTGIYLMDLQFVPR